MRAPYLVVQLCLSKAIRYKMAGEAQIFMA